MFLLDSRVILLKRHLFLRANSLETDNSYACLNSRALECLLDLAALVFSRAQGAVKAGVLPEDGAVWCYGWNCNGGKK